mgnify:CR=1 FL=1
MEPTLKFELTGTEANLVLAALSSFTAPLVQKLQDQAKEQIVQHSADTINAESEVDTHD